MLNRLNRQIRATSIVGGALALLLLHPGAAHAVGIGLINLDRGVESIDDGANQFYMNFLITTNADSVIVDSQDADGACGSGPMYALDVSESSATTFFGAFGGFGTAGDRNDCFPNGDYQITFVDDDGPNMIVDLVFAAPTAPNGSVDVTTVNGSIDANMATIPFTPAPTFDWTQSTCTNCKSVCDSGGAAINSNLEISTWRDTEGGYNPIDYELGLAQTATQFTLPGGLLQDEMSYKYSVKVLNQLILQSNGCDNPNPPFNITFQSSVTDSVTFFTPEPGPIFLVGAGLAGLAAMGRRRRRS